MSREKLKTQAMNMKLVLAFIAALIVGFGGGYLVWEALLGDFMKDNTAPGMIALERTEPMYGIMLIGGVAQTLLITWIINGFRAKTAVKGLVTGGIFGLLIATTYDTYLYGMYDMWTSTGVLVDIVTNTVFAAVIGAVVGAILGSGKKAAAPAM